MDCNNDREFKARYYIIPLTSSNTIRSLFSCLLGEIIASPIVSYMLCGNGITSFNICVGMRHWKCGVIFILGHSKMRTNCQQERPVVNNRIYLIAEKAGNAVFFSNGRVVSTRSYQAMVLWIIRDR